MKNAYLLLTALLLGSSFGSSIQAKDSVRFNLALDGLVPKVGIETEKTISKSVTFCFTNDIKGEQFVTNSSWSFEIKFRDKILTWDASNDFAKAEMVVDHFLFTEKDKTNEIVKPGTSLTGIFVAGEWSFVPSDGHLSDNVIQSLDKIFPMNPQHGIKDYDYLELNHPRLLGEIWKIETVPDLSRLNGLDNSFSSFIARTVVKGMNTNSVKSTAEFVGTTNISGFNCFQLRQTSNMHSETKRMDTFGELEADLIVPFDSSRSFWKKSAAVNGLLLCKELKNGTNTIPIHGKFSMKIIIDCREVTKKGH